MKGNHRTLFGQSLLSEATSGDLVVEAYPGSTLTDNAVSIAHFDYFNQQNLFSSYAEARSSLFFGLDRPAVIARFFRGERIRTIRSNETLALNMIQILEGVSRRPNFCAHLREVTLRL
jgi:hypothetical protein